jgi:hypothetical protein
VTVTVKFALSNMPFPPVSSRSRAPEVPTDFDFGYRYECEAGRWQVGTSNGVTGMPTPGLDEGRIDRALADARFFDGLAMRNIPTVSSVAITGNGVEVTVISEPNRVGVTTTRHPPPPGTVQPPRPTRFRHTLSVTRAGREYWASWEEPAADQQSRDLAALGQLVRTMAGATDCP